MTQEQKELLLKDLCTRLPYGIAIYRIKDSSIHRFQYSDITENIVQFSHFLEYPGIDDIKPYLRPMSSMTDVEFFIYKNTPFINKLGFCLGGYWDYYELIPKGLALEAPEGMYNTK